jgi:beta-N-acetylhexosaminidase
VAACAKHFPGHGSTEQDSHLELPLVVGDAREGLPPFRAAIEAGVKTIMTAHVRVPALDDAPATVSPAVVQGLLRDVLGFDGVVIADALEMKGLSDSVGIERGAVLALEAGVDALLIGHDLGEDAVEAVQRALVSSVSETRLREAAGRVARVGEWAASAPVGGPVDRGAGEKAARLALQVDGDVSLESAPFVVELRPQANIAAGDAAHSLGAVIEERLPGSEAVVFDEASAHPATAERMAGARPVVIVVRDAHRHRWMQEFADRLPSSVLVEVGLPVWRPAGARGYAATYGGSRVSYEALADVLLERLAVTA